MEAGGKSACGGDRPLGDFACEEGADSTEADESGDASGNEREVGGVAGLTNALLGDCVFDLAVRVWGWVE